MLAAGLSPSDMDSRGNGGSMILPNSGKGWCGCTFENSDNSGGSLHFPGLEKTGETASLLFPSIPN